jgi:stage II sporulation protein AA (anti-sigma F factor antagonist)
MSAFEVEQAIPVLVLRGELDIAAKDQFSEALRQAVEPGGLVVLDLRELSFMDSTGIGVLLSATKTLGPRGTIILYGATGVVGRAMGVVCIQDVPGIVVVPADESPPPLQRIAG